MGAELAPRPHGSAAKPTTGLEVGADQSRAGGWAQGSCFLPALFRISPLQSLLGTCQAPSCSCLPEKAFLGLTPTLDLGSVQWLHLQTRPITCKVSGTAVLSCIQSPCLLGSLASYLDYQLPKSLPCPRQPCNPGPQQDPSALRLHLSPGGKCDLQGHILQRRAKEEAPLLPQASSQQHRVKRAGRTARSRRQARRSLPRDGDLFPSQMQARITRPQLASAELPGAGLADPVQGGVSLAVSAFPWGW